MEQRIIRLDVIDSTNIYLKDLARNGAQDGTVVVAAHQTAGKGRTGNSFESDEGGLYFSVLFRTDDLELSETTSLTTKTGVAASDAICDITGSAPGIKWVNDLILNGKKIAGILVEAGPVQNGKISYVVIGIGINVNQRVFPPVISAKATSLCLEYGKEFILSEVEAALIGRMEILRSQLHGRVRIPEQNRNQKKNYAASQEQHSSSARISASDEIYLQKYRERCVTLGKTVSFERNDEKMICTASAITEDYGLLVTYPDGNTEVLRSGEVRVRGIDGYV